MRTRWEIDRQFADRALKSGSATPLHSAAEAGMPVPRSANWRIPCRAAQVTARAMNSRFSRSAADSDGQISVRRPASSRSAA